MTGRWIIYAPNVHVGGGRSQLLVLLRSLSRDLHGQVFLDARLDPVPGLPKGLSVERVEPSPRDRLLAEWRLRRSAATAGRVLCFGNLPPLFKLSSRVAVFLQNRYLVESASSRGFASKARIRMAVERHWVASLCTHADVFIVQTPSMKNSLESRLGSRVPTYVVPVIAGVHDFGIARRACRGQRADANEFVYVASGEPHKNHRRLVEAWRLLALGGISPRLYLTVSDSDWPQLCGWIDEMKRSSHLNIENLGSISSSEIGQLYSPGRALIYPSTFESFGLPLVEARQAGLPIVASELDYVRDVVDPEESFEPTSVVSIARAVKRFLGISEPPLPLTEPKDFLARLEGLAEMAAPDYGGAP